jgi:hypothetical protein
MRSQFGSVTKGRAQSQAAQDVLVEIFARQQAYRGKRSSRSGELRSSPQDALAQLHSEFFD